MNKHVSARPADRATAATSKDGVREAAPQTRIGRTYRFEAAHYLPLVPEGHRCRNLHGHNYRLTIVVHGKLDARGFVKDFAEIDAVVALLIEQVDHRLLNDVEGLENPTAEIIAAWFFNRIQNCERVCVFENEDSWAEVLR
jgi:6-pyruvoyltetrahydropterin/6-carboxytetrahydropterin synthase